MAVLVPVWIATPAGAVASANWSQYLYGGSHSSYNRSATTIAPTNIGALNPEWQWVDPAPTHGGYNVLRASPTVVNGVIYIGDEDGRFYAIQESTRKVLWSQFIGVVKQTTCGTAGIISTAAVATDPSTGTLAVYVDGPDGYMYAFDASTGSIIWQATVAIPSTTVNDYYAWGSPLVANGTVYIGISSMCDKPLVPAGLVAFSQATGQQVAEWHSLPNTMKGASIWSSPGLSSDGSVIVTTGNAAKTPQPQWGESIVKLSGSSLAVESAWQVPVTQRGYDSDFGASPTMFSATLTGHRAPMVGACNKNGMFYAFKQHDLAAGPVWEQHLAAPYTTSKGQCDSAAIWDGSRLIAASGNTVDVGGTMYNGAVESLNPANGVPIWMTGLPGGVIGSPTEDGAGVIAAPVWWSSTGSYGVYLIQASDGALLGNITLTTGTFSQPVFAKNYLLVADGHTLTAYGITQPETPLASVAPSTLIRGSTRIVRITGSGFSSTSNVIVSGSDVYVTSAHVTSSNEISATIQATTAAALGSRDLTVTTSTSSGLVTASCNACLRVVKRTQTSIASSVDPAPFDEPITFTATVAPSDGGGAVSFESNGAVIATCGSQPLSPTTGGGATATCRTSSLGVGTWRIVAVYSGDADFRSSLGGLKGGQSVFLPAPTGLTATVKSVHSVQLAWTPVAGATRYVIFEATSATGPFARVKAVSTDGYRIYHLTSGTTYYFKVRARTTTGLSAFSSTVAATP